VYLGKKRKYITLVIDLRTGRVIHIGKGKGKDALHSQPAQSPHQHRQTGGNQL